MEENYKINIIENKDKVEVEITLPSQRYASLHNIQTTGFKERRVREIVTNSKFNIGALLCSPTQRVANDRPVDTGDLLKGVWVYENLNYKQPVADTSSAPPKVRVTKTLAPKNTSNNTSVGNNIDKTKNTGRKTTSRRSSKKTSRKKQ